MDAAFRTSPSSKPKPKQPRPTSLLIFDKRTFFARPTSGQRFRLSSIVACTITCAVWTSRDSSECLRVSPSLVVCI